MYEAHFGFSGTPFSLNPDPAFFFQSKGHGNALSYLRYGVYQGEGFVVVTGEIGAGKTTLVRTLLSELDESKIVAAQIVSTQLEAGDLLRSVAIAFGVTPKSLSKAELIASIEAFLTLLVTQDKRALLIVDEAQNLNPQAVEELRMLSNFQLGSHALLQSFLVGQPELRQLLTSKPMEQFRQRVIASCHLGAMDAGETREYIEHRLRKVGWKDVPAIDVTAFERIHHWSAGIPRRVNLLCNRLLLSAYLTSAVNILADDVDAVASEVSAEVGEAKSHLASLAEATGDAPASRIEATVHVERPILRVTSRPLASSPQAGPIACVATDRGDEAKLIALLSELQDREGVPPLLLIRAGDPARFAASDEFLQSVGIDMPVVELELDDATTPTARMAHAMQSFEPLLGLHEPAAVVLASVSDAALACAIAADKFRCPVIHADWALHPAEPTATEANEAMLACLAMRMAGVRGASPTDETLVADAVALATSENVHPTPIARFTNPRFMALAQERGYALLTLDASIEAADRRTVVDLLSALREVAATMPLLWIARPTTTKRLEAFGLKSLLKGDRLAIAQPLSYPAYIASMNGARGVIADSADVQAEAQLLGLACASLGDARALIHGWGQTPRQPRTPQPTGACSRLAAALLEWLDRRHAAGRTLERQTGS